MAKGHRERLRQLVEDVGLENLSIYQKMEYILFYVLPRVNTTQVAHNLIDTFGSIHAVLEASVSDLELVEGLGPSSARQLSHMIQVLDLYQESKSNCKQDLSTLSKAAKFFYDLLYLKDKEFLYIACLDNKGNLISYKRITSDSDESVTFKKSEVFKYVTSNKTKRIILCHNHPKQSCNPSKDDDDHTDQLKFILNSVAVNLEDHLIVGNDGVFSFRYSSILKLPIDKDSILEKYIKDDN